MWRIPSLCFLKAVGSLSGTDYTGNLSAAGPVKTDIVGQLRTKRFKSGRKGGQDYLNYLITQKEWWNTELKQRNCSFLSLIAGSAFRKVYYDP